MSWSSALSLLERSKLVERKMLPPEGDWPTSFTVTVDVGRQFDEWITCMGQLEEEGWMPVTLAVVSLGEYAAVVGMFRFLTAADRANIAIAQARQAQGAGLQLPNLRPA